MLLLLTTFLLIRRSTAVDTVSWSSAPNARGTWELIIGCVFTLTICVWSALHLNVPTENSTLTQRNLRRTKWILLGIFTPELVVSSAFAQYLTARWMRREILDDAKFRRADLCNTASSTWSGHDQQLQEWSITQCYFAVMGGITVQAKDCLGISERVNLTPEGIRLLSFLGRLPMIHESQVRDKSKADGLAKTIVCLQAGWMILQILARLHQRLTVTLLEINTIGHVLCALVLYLLWWSKPLEVKDPVLLNHEDWMDPYLSLMWMCSPISGSNEDEITEMRCMTYIPKPQRITGSTDGEAGPSLPEQRPKLRAHETHFSVGSTAAKNPMKFIGPLGGFHIGSTSYNASSPAPFDHHVSYNITEKGLNIAPEHEVFSQLQEAHHGLRHGTQYCRRAFADCKTHDSLTPDAIQRWQHANIIVDELWTQCEKRPRYMETYFTTSTLGIFVGEISYINVQASNFLGVSYLGHLNVHKDYLKSVLSFAGAAYGAIHIAAWNEYFPTALERYLWIASSVTLGGIGVFLWLFFLVKQSIEKVDRGASKVGKTRVFGFVVRYVFGPVFVAARIYLVVEGFVSLRAVRKDVYETPEWSKYLPHF